MKTGMLWYDNDPKTGFGDKVTRAATYYRNKYGADPDLCFVNTNEAEVEQVGRVTVKASREVMPRHFWLGRGEE